MHRIQKVSKGMTLILTGALGVSALFILAFLFYPELAVQPFYAAQIISPDGPPLALWQRMAMAGLAVLGMVPALYIMWHFRALFRRFAAGHIFTASATAHLFKAAKGMVLGGVIAIANTTFGALVLTANAPAGQHVFTVAVSSGQLAGILAGVIFVVMGWVMQEAARLSDENAGFV
jgi:hypothetical protein